MLQEETLILLPLSDIRGYDTSGAKAGVYISEAQNLDVELMKLALQRIGEDSICIIDGDCKTQVDDISFAGINNGMRRASQVFRGQDIYGEITLKNIHRSRIAQIAENNLVRPYIFGKFLDIHPLIIYLFLFITAQYLGIVGVIFAPAIAATICVLIQELYIRNIN